MGTWHKCKVIKRQRRMETRFFTPCSIVRGGKGTLTLKEPALHFLSLGEENIKFLGTGLGLVDTVSHCSGKCHG